MPGNPYRVVMLLLAILGIALGAVFAGLALLAEDPVRAAGAALVAYWAGGIGGFWFAVWLIVSAARWKPAPE